jgi:hypothetical protein
MRDPVVLDSVVDEAAGESYVRARTNLQEWILLFGARDCLGFQNLL